MGLRVIELGRMEYREAHELQRAHVEEVIAAREGGGGHGSPGRAGGAFSEGARLEGSRPGEPCHLGGAEWGRLLLVEHEPVVTISRRKGAGAHLLASEAELAAAGVTVEPTDRGGDITYHGPGQLVAYPILDLNVLMLRLHDYMRLLEQSVIDTLAGFGVEGVRDAEATGVWVEVARHRVDAPAGQLAKIAAMGVRVRRWVSMHGLALNVVTDPRHFQLIVPCGLAGRGVTSLAELLGEACPEMREVKAGLVRALESRLGEAAARAGTHRSGA